MRHIEILDSTLRDGAQSESISFSVADKLAIAELIGSLGIEYIEAGNPGSNPKDTEFFLRASEAHTFNSLVAFGATRHVGCACDEDLSLTALSSANVPCVSVFGKAAQSHVRDILKVSDSENLRIIEESCAFLKEKGKQVFFDAEHFFDGFKENREYAVNCLEAAVAGGADRLILCDTVGGSFPDFVYSTTKEICKLFSGIIIGIHAHNDCAMAVANSVSAVQAGAGHVQGTLLGIGERCGNASLSAVIANLQLKLGYDVLPKGKIEKLTPICRSIAEICNTGIKRTEPYIGTSAFAHKAGMHVDSVLKRADTYEHIPPESVGNERRFLMSEFAGRSALIKKIQNIAPNLSRDSESTSAIIERLKRREHKGYQFEGAEASFELLVRRTLPDWKPFFELVKYRVHSERPHEEGASATAVVKVRVGTKEVLRCAEGDGPVNALDKALRHSLEVFYPVLRTVHLTDYKVRVMDANKATASLVRVLITSTDGIKMWTTVGVSADIMEASFKALCDSVEYKLTAE